jgi:4-amino-4-deoxy-L-arabinose transferase-like glycosyltransferase
MNTNKASSHKPLASSYSPFKGVFFAIIGALFFIPFLGNVHLFDWDEVNFAEIAREMIVTGNYAEPQINFITFTEKPPLFFWLQAISMKLFGVNEFAARFPNALLGVCVLPLLYSLGRRMKDQRLGILWALCYFGTVLPHLYFKSGIIDPLFNFFIFLSIYGIARATWARQAAQKNLGWIVFAGAATGIAILTKGPVAILIAGLVFFFYWVFNRFKLFISIPQGILFVFTALFVTGLWMGINYLQNGPDFIREFTIRQWELFSTPDAGHKGFFLYHFVVLFFGCFPASAFLIRALLRTKENDPRMADFAKWMKILFWVVLILFTIVTTKIVHYSSLAYYPISFLTAYCLYKIVNGEWVISKWMKATLIVSGLPLLLLPIVAAYFGQNMESLRSLVKKDVFTYENLLANVNWTGWEFIPALVLIAALILSLRWFAKNKAMKGTVALFAGTAVFLQLALFFLIGRVEAYSQRTPIEFWESKKGIDAYLSPYNFKSFAHFFYGDTKAHERRDYLVNDWHLGPDIDKPVYIALRADIKASFEKRIPDAKLLYSKNGFYFYERLPLRR